ncbi:flagellar hook-basal body complex protein FliE [Pengzhenrongella sicca]|uniref:Flagellar hook-basal body complex protein FliE n=1 Tax=Pengzhenrongella sicca TaxID=2819238 RepID=A0A8A4ZFU5_9MICO|nr:flagellar hook-basal body complex protein FliE [Pengzhenrongella sicca]QTE29869.1 flagellar hook-basal body complex protein FliE [Pengzhenrongella sicca]
MSIAAIGAVSGLATAVTGVQGTGYATAATPTEAGAGFGSVLTSSLESLQGLQTTSSDLAVKAVTGDLDDVHDYTIAASEAKTALQLTAAVRNKAIEAFTEIMRMQA